MNRDLSPKEFESRSNNPHAIRERERDAHEKTYVAPSTPESRDARSAKEALIEGCKAIIRAGERGYGVAEVRRHQELLNRLLSEHQDYNSSHKQTERRRWISTDSLPSFFPTL